ncbi:MAG: SpoIIE family protein phosphatase [Magnetospirillum gryphiswaldense]|nr:SpoIIE family protein phosphatase [Magnetospirillum gryphiswaldense]
MCAALARALVVDDERMNREVIVANLRAAGFETVTAEDGLQAWEILDAHPGAFDVILLDRRMPRMDGMELLRKLKDDSRLDHIPVIMQTAYADPEDVTAGIKAGAYYYLAKPLDRRLLLSVTEAAIADHQRRQRLLDDLDKRTTAMLLLDSGTFRFRTLDEGHTLAVALARACPQARHLVAGLSELFTNAVEHGNLGIGYDEKAHLLENRRWRQEVEARLDTPGGRARMVEVEVTRQTERICFVIRDQGDGFDWRGFGQISPERAFAPHGRGIALARNLAFDHMEYNDIGNQVTAWIDMADTSADRGQAVCAIASSLKVDAPPLVSEEIQLARAMQLELLPPQKSLDDLLRRSGLLLSAHFETSSSLGGDLWGMQVVDQYRTGLWVADFSGHGLVAALNVFRLHALVAQCAPVADMPAAFLAELSRRLSELLPVGQYATMIYGVVDQSAGLFRYAAAAMPPPLLRRTDGRVEKGDGAGLPLGLSARATYAERQMALSPGGLLFLSSDGLADNPDGDGNKLGNGGIKMLIEASGQEATANSVLAPFLARVARPLRDDLTAVCCRLP